MRRDMELIRRLLLCAEAEQPVRLIEEYTPEQIRYHQMLAIDAGLLKGKHHAYMNNSSNIPDSVFVEDVTWEGHDFLEAVRDDNNWVKLKKYLVESGKVVTLETLVAGAKVLFGIAS